MDTVSGFHFSSVCKTAELVTHRKSRDSGSSKAIWFFTHFPFFREKVSFTLGMLLVVEISNGVVFVVFVIRLDFGLHIRYGLLNCAVSLQTLL